MKKDDLIQQTAEYIREIFKIEGSGHDWWHIHRVWQLSTWIAQQEGANLFIVEMAALLHDLDDWKLNPQEEAKACKWMEQIGLNADEHKEIQQVIDQVSFKGAEVDTTPDSLEAQVVQDADRLDAMGAIGIARTFAYGGHKNRLIYDPEVQPVLHDSFDAYQKSTAPTINHFYEKLLLLKDRINTPSGQELAQQRHLFMESYLEQFFQEWHKQEQV
ncbi:HD domain-containing protein [Sunxiuqinia sp. sy24]|uniref:HD domain-containing protein n=1 Tax=Sunxiuqinia sp. sy24 TaxID=3461495 RepID=UPI0040457DB3